MPSRHTLALKVRPEDSVKRDFMLDPGVVCQSSRWSMERCSPPTARIKCKVDFNPVPVQNSVVLHHYLLSRVSRISQALFRIFALALTGWGERKTFDAFQGLESLWRGLTSGLLVLWDKLDVALQFNVSLRIRDAQ